MCWNDCEQRSVQNRKENEEHSSSYTEVRKEIKALVVRSLETIPDPKGTRG